MEVVIYFFFTVLLHQSQGSPWISQSTLIFSQLLESLWYNYKTVEWLRLEGTSGGHLVQLPAQAVSPAAGCPIPCSDGFWISLGMETPQPLFDNLSQCSVMLRVKKDFLMFIGSLPSWDTI